MHILLTRPIEDCKDLIIKFKNLGHTVSHMPVIKIDKLNYEIKKVEEFKAIIFTSANAIKYLDTKLIDKKILSFCVGEATERKARSNGFQNIISAEGNVNNLKELIIQNLEPSYGKMLYVSGETISNELDKDLSSHGYRVERIITYSAKFVENLDENFIESLKKNIPDIVYIYSANSAASFLRLIKNYDIGNLWMDTNLMCISEKTSSILNEIKWKKIFIFRPGEEQFLLYKI
ncbi:MAG: uroporphyrinogen-III synthase [Candidatus Pelagibacter sp.]|tara:strand:+ start:114 stop:812 length:699 start_codon:yes stop_codon:yes gene_type:complete